MLKIVVKYFIHSTVTISILFLSLVLFYHNPDEFNSNFQLRCPTIIIDVCLTLQKPFFLIAEKKLFFFI